jgi:ribosomal protein S18 acetylase RimI-like enzyme
MCTGVLGRFYSPSGYCLVADRRPVKGSPVVQYRTFLNTDPPQIASVWNEAFTGRGAVFLRHSLPLENYAFSKSYFDPAGLIVAVEDGAVVGFSHAGFGPNALQTAISRSIGVICAIGVRPQYRRRGIGSELLRRGEAYLTAAGAGEIYAGPMAPFNSFYFGVYGGSELPGFLDSDKMSMPFLKHHSYEACDTTLLFQRKLDQPITVTDGRFAALRRQYDVRIVPRTGTGTWWQECKWGPIEPVEFRLEEKSTGQMVGQTSVWEMDLFGWRWNQPAVGIIEMEIKPELRRQGLAKFLLAQMLRYLQEQFFGIAEVQTMENNQQALGLYKSLGFEQVDTGRIYKKR